MITKKQLAIKLSKLKAFENPSAKLEQYQTDSEIAASILWFAYQQGDIEGKVIADFGCGTGILGHGAILLGAKRVYFVDTDDKALAIAQEQVKSDKAYFVNEDILNFKFEIDTVIQNPPFGTKVEHSDKTFLEKAMMLSGNIYSMHKITTQKFVFSISESNGFRVVHLMEFKLPLKKTMKFHKKPVKYIDIGCWHLKRNL